MVLFSGAGRGARPGGARPGRAGGLAGPARSSTRGTRGPAGAAAPPRRGAVAGPAQEGGEGPEGELERERERERLRRERIGAAMRRKWEDPEYRARREAVSERTKRKQAASAKEQWADPGFRERAVAGLKGRAAWNKGRKLTAAHRQRIREAKAGRKVSEETKERMRASATGRRHSEATRAKMSQSRKGRKLSPAHREAISQAMKRCKARGGSPPALAMVDGAEGASREWEVPAAGPSGRGDLSSCRETLQEFRALKEDLAPWAAEFAAAHGRAPEWRDARAAGDSALAARVQRCARLKQQLQLQIPKLRSTGAFKGGPGALEGGGSAGARSVEAAPPASEGRAGDRAMRKALDYKAKREAHRQGDSVGGGAEDEAPAPGTAQGDVCEVRPLRRASPLMAGRVRAAFERAAKYRARG